MEIATFTQAPLLGGPLSHHINAQLEHAGSIARKSLTRNKGASHDTR